eukprot:CAMPEP_0174737112 /NCGR_PEP_ID=MMETSP1094-20130205/67806_1 /TAXON_ID=156173 /ORGANISM="Chrysochromulina brevifilum, Strain UTEX LB 985" /LENGTH=53 /DNA_ID=CAMNT_0015940297 /DNA_START=66 /DNA_END=227 /DNA_ORIENTATION=-
MVRAMKTTTGTHTGDFTIPRLYQVPGPTRLLLLESWPLASLTPPADIDLHGEF